MSKKKVKLLFVCSGNIFRSMSAEYCLKDYLKKKKITTIEVRSAGIHAKKQVMDKAVLQALLKKKIDPRKHVQRRITQKIYDAADLIVAMGENHYDYIVKHFGKGKVVLYKEILLGKRLSLRDVEEEYPQKSRGSKEFNFYFNFVPTYIYEHTEQFYKQLQKYILFREFVLGIAKRNEGLSFVRLYETKHTLSFMSIDIPSTLDGHILVIPKNIYLSLEDVPSKVLHELIESVQFMGSVVTEMYEGYNILLNEGKASGHSMNHVHFHVIPRKQGDKIHLETWRKKVLNAQNFKVMNEKIKRAVTQRLRDQN